MDMIQAPHNRVGATLRKGGDVVKKRRQFDKLTGRPGETVHIERQPVTPVRVAGLVPDVVVPLAQALLTGALLAALVVFLLGELAPNFDGNRWAVWFALALAITAAAWLLLLSDTRRLLWGIEVLTGQDLDGDAQIGRPEVEEKLVIVNAEQSAQKSAQREKSERASEFYRFVADLPARGTAARSWEKKLGRDVYQQYRDALIRLGWARWNSVNDDGTPNERRGWTLTEPVPDILRRISS